MEFVRQNCDTQKKNCSIVSEMYDCSWKTGHKPHHLIDQSIVIGLLYGCIFKHILESIIQSHQDATEAKVLDEMGRFLNYAPGRIGGGGRVK